MLWQFERRARRVEPHGELNILHSRLALAVQMLAELGYSAEYRRLSEKFVGGDMHGTTPPPATDPATS
jgi:hypothetical protein